MPRHIAPPQGVRPRRTAGRVVRSLMNRSVGARHSPSPGRLARGVREAFKNRINPGDRHDDGARRFVRAPLPEESP